MQRARFQRAQQQEVSSHLWVLVEMKLTTLKENVPVGTPAKREENSKLPKLLAGLRNSSSREIQVLGTELSVLISVPFQQRAF